VSSPHDPEWVRLGPARDSLMAALRQHAPGDMGAQAMRALVRQVVREFMEQGWFVEPEGCHHILSVGNTFPDSPQFGPTEYCDELALLGQKYCEAHRA